MDQDREHILPHLEGIRDEKRTAANTALRVGEALIMLLDYISQVDSGGKFLSRVSNDSAQGVITFLQGLLLGDGAHGIGADGAAQLLSMAFDSVLKSKDARSGFNDGKGIWMDAIRGIIQTDGLEVRGWMRIMELVINRLQLMESDYSFTEGGEIEHVDYTDGAQLVLHVRKRHDNDIVPFYEGDILYAKVNDLLPQGAVPQGHTVTGHGSYFTVWMVVDSVDQAENTITVSLYASQHEGGRPIVPGGLNFTLYGTPISGTDDPSVAVSAEKVTVTEGGTLGEVGFDCSINVTRHGNVAGSQNEQTRTMQKQRQQSWVLSTTDQRLAYYWHVDQPIIRDDNYALILGILPDLANLPSTRDPRMPSLYVNTIFYENAHHIYYPPQVVKVDRGLWTQNPTAIYTGIGGTYTADATLSDESLAAEVAAGRMSADDEARLKVIRSWAGTYVQDQTISEPYHFESFSRNMWLTHRLSPADQSLTDLMVWKKMTKEWHVDKETSRVWHYGALWECLVEGTAEEPGISRHWTMISGQALRIDFYFSRGTMVWLDDVHLLAEARILIGSADVTDELLERVAAGSMDITWTWERMAYEDGTQTAADEMWQPVTQDGHPNILVIDHKLNDPARRTDCGPLWESEMHVWFRCTARLSTGGTAEGEMGMGQI